MRLLDCGCGPGTITAGLARLVAPGEATGVDREPSQIAAAAERFRAEGLKGKFLAGSIYDLPFPDESFDVVFSHALFEHLKEPRRGLEEIRRVLKPGGLVALRSPDWGGFIVAPASPGIERALEYYQKLQRENGGDVLAGRKLKGWLVEGGFEEARVSASYESYEPIGTITEYLALRIEDSPARDLAVERGWTTAPEAAEMAAALRSLAGDPGAVFLQSWCEAMGRKRS